MCGFLWSAIQYSRQTDQKINQSKLIPCVTNPLTHLTCASQKINERNIMVETKWLANHIVSTTFPPLIF